jgi:hypothetical protein
MIGGSAGGVLLVGAAIVGVTLFLRQRPADGDSSSGSQETEGGNADSVGQFFLGQSLQSNFPSLMGVCVGDGTELWTMEMPDETEGIGGAARP